MSGYDLKQLSSRDFEELTRDLLQAEWGVALEAFKTGRDGGIDLRRISAANGTTIAQCKHFAVSGYSKLLSRLRSSEVDKVKRLNPTRYVLVTSVELSPPNKDAIQELFRPFIQSPNDVIGANDLDGLLRRHPDVARSNFKLWLTSTEILERVLHNAEIVQTEFEVERVMRKLPIFVQNAAFPRARDILNTTNVLVVSGVPGIGKTTLAEILLYTHLEQGYEPVVIENDLREGKNLFNSRRRQVFYFDDFLGQTFLGEDRFPGGMNSDASLVDFVAMVKATGHSRLILTTREHLLRSAYTASERLRHSALVDHRCLLALGDYSKGQRARILYNHVYFSDLSRDYKEEILRDDFFLEIVGHKHYSPRLIEWLAASSRLRDIPSTEYQTHIRKILANPQEIWSHAFNQQISPSARNVLLVLHSNGGYCELRDLEPMWNSLNAHTAQKYNRAVDARDYGRALKELDNAFVSYQKGRAEFLNPSVRDMIAAEIREYPELGLDVIAGACRFQQITAIVDLARLDGNSTLQRTLIQNVTVVVGGITRLLRTPHLRWETNAQGKYLGHYIDVAFEERLIQIGRLASMLNSQSLRALFEKEAEDLAGRYEKNGVSMTEATSLTKAFDKFPELKAGKGAVLQRRLLDAILSEGTWWADQLNVLIRFSNDISIWSQSDEAKLQAAIEQYQKSGVDDEVRDCRDADQYAGLRDDLSTLGEAIGVSFQEELQKLDERIGELERPEPEYRSASGSMRTAEAVDLQSDTDAAIRDVFGTLLD
jgi:hypothetical protein